MEIKEMEKRINELKEKGYGKCADLARELELCLYQDLVDILKSNDKKLKYVGQDLDLMCNEIIENIFNKFIDSIYNKNIDKLTDLIQED